MPVETLEELLALPLFSLHPRLQHQHPMVMELVLERLVDRIEQNKDVYKYDDPDGLHNVATDASRINRTDLEERLFRLGIELFPENVDLRADLLQLLYGQKNSPDEAQQCWDERYSSFIR